MASIILTKKEEKLLDQHYKVHLQRLLKLHQATPGPVVYFLAGSLPFVAHLHLKIFSVFGQLCRLEDGENILATQACSVFSSANGSSRSWFWKLRGLCLQYDLLHPSKWLTSQMSKAQVKNMTRSAVHQYWRKELQTKADVLSSLCYMKTAFMSLTATHPLFTSCLSSPWETEKTVIQARHLSGRCRLEALSGHWTPGNRGGLCTLPDCWGTPACYKGSVESFLLTCPSLADTRIELAISNLRFLHDHPDLEDLVRQCLVTDEVQFWLDCSTMPAVILAVQQSEGFKVLEPLFKMTRNYCHRLHVTRMKIISDLT